MITLEKRPKASIFCIVLFTLVTLGAAQAAAGTHAVRIPADVPLHIPARAEPAAARDVAVGPDGVAVFYWRFLENAQNPYRVDLNLPLGPEQLLGGFGSGDTGGGD